MTYEVVDLGGTPVTATTPVVAGPAGKSAYQLAVENGFVGTVEEWLDSLEGGGDLVTSVNGDIGAVVLTAADVGADASGAAAAAQAAAIAAAATDATTKVATETTRATTAEAGLATAGALAAHVADTANPHAVTKAQVGLSNADNTADSAKPVSTAQAAADTAIGAAAATDATTKADAAQAAAIAAAATDATTKANAAQAASQPLDSDLTAFAAKTAPSGAVVGTTDTQTLTNKTLTSPAITTPTGLVKGDVGLGNADNTTDASVLATAATAAAAASKSADTITDGTTNKAFLATERTTLAAIPTYRSVDTTVRTAANTTADTVLNTFTTVASGALAVGQVYDLVLDGSLDTIASGGAFALKIKIGATTLTVSPNLTVSRTSAGTLLWRVWYSLYIEAVGAGGVVSCVGTTEVWAGAASATAVPIARADLAHSVSLSSGLALTTVASMATANAGNTITVSRARLVQVA